MDRPLITSGRLAAAYYGWRATESRALGRPLIRALEARDYETRHVASAYLCHPAVSRLAVPLLLEALDTSNAREEVITCLAAQKFSSNAEREDVRARMVKLVGSSNPEVALAARSALREIDSEGRFL